VLTKAGTLSRMRRKSRSTVLTVDMSFQNLNGDVAIMPASGTAAT
jgi:hypothetical protein